MNKKTNLPFTKIQLISLFIFVVINFFLIVININSVSSFEIEQAKTEAKIKNEQNKLINNRNTIENQVVDEIKRKKITSDDEKINPAEVININQLPPAKKN
jgi:cell division protein FtsI/penicillin-binding protein 2